MKTIVITEEDFKEAFAKAMDVYFDSSEKTGANSGQMLVDSLLVATFSVILQNFLFEKGVDDSQINVK